MFYLQTHTHFLDFRDISIATKSKSSRKPLLLWKARRPWAAVPVTTGDGRHEVSPPLSTYSYNYRLLSSRFLGRGQLQNGRQRPATTTRTSCARKWWIYDNESLYERPWSIESSCTATTGDSLLLGILVCTPAVGSWITAFEGCSVDGRGGGTRCSCQCQC